MTSLSQRLLGLSPRLTGSLFRGAAKLPFIGARLEREYDRLLAPLDRDLHPYRDQHPTFTAVPERGLGHSAVLALVRELAEAERERTAQGLVSGAVYHDGEQHVALLNEVYALTSQSNPLHADVWPSSAKFEAEIVAMTARLLGSERAEVTAEPITGTVTSGGTESIILAMKAYRDRARAERGLRQAQIVAPVTAHAAFDKAAALLGMDMVRVPVTAEFTADAVALAAAITRHSVVLVGSAPSYPHGVVDPIAELAELAQSHKLGLHVDACLGGFVLPWAERLGYRVPSFDFRLAGVTSMSADTHKYGYAAKGTSVVLYRGKRLRHYQYFVSTDWPGGIYYSPTLSGSRPGGLSAACWASLVSIGENGYLEATDRIIATTAWIRKRVARIAGLELYGDSLFVVAFGSPELDIYRVLELMSERGWSLNGLQRPACLHLCVTLLHTREGVAARFIDDLEYSVAEAGSAPAKPTGLAPVYGLAASFPVRGAVAELLKRYVDRLYEA